VKNVGSNNLQEIAFLVEICLKEEFEYTWGIGDYHCLRNVVKIPRGVIRIRKPKKNWQHNGQKKKYKGTYNDLQNIHIKLKIE